MGKETAGGGWGYWSDTSDHRDDRQSGPDRTARQAGWTVQPQEDPSLGGSWPRRQPAAVNHRALFLPRPPALLGRRIKHQPTRSADRARRDTVTAASSRPQGEIKQMACNMDTQKSSAFRFKISYEVEGGWVSCLVSSF